MLLLALIDICETYFTAAADGKQISIMERLIHIPTVFDRYNYLTYDLAL